jgi:excisionase family DNA binding protein
MQKIITHHQSKIAEAALETKKNFTTAKCNPSIVADEYLSPKEAARFLKCSKSFLDKLRCSGGGPSFTRIGRKILYRRFADLEAWMRQRRFASTSEYGPEYR